MTDNNQTFINCHQFHRATDGSTCVRQQPGDPWTMVKGNSSSNAHKFMKVQNRFWKPWIKDAIARFNSTKRIKFIRRQK